MTTTDYLLDTNACIAIRQLLANKLRVPALRVEDWTI